MTPSPKYKLNLRDVLRGLLIAGLTPVLFLIQQSVEAGHLEFEPKKMAMAAIAGGVAYLIKNFFQNN